ncbi:hypothetical protein HDC93_007018 [Streptomyces sp. AK010]|nr:hypothetical protein [Streptomyces sp. AK010]MBB6421385.1 hypothetical protein [Streptomyces sp. AK010]
MLAGLDAHLLGESGAQPVIGVERVDLPAQPDAADHQQLAEPLAQRVLTGQRHEFAQHLVVQPLPEQQFGPLLDGGEPQFCQAVAFVVGVRARDTAVGRALPQAERGVQGGHGPVDGSQGAVLPRGLQEGLEPQLVDLVRCQHQRVAIASGGQQLGVAAAAAAGVERLPEPRDIGVDAVDRSRRCLPVPHGLDEFPAAHHLLCACRQNGEHGLLLRRAQVHLSFADPQSCRPEKPCS